MIEILSVFMPLESYGAEPIPLFSLGLLVILIFFLSSCSRIYLGKKDYPDFNPELQANQLGEIVLPYEDGLRTTGQPKEYEWWYFDTKLDDGSIAVVYFWKINAVKDIYYIGVNYNKPDGTEYKKINIGGIDVECYIIDIPKEKLELKFPVNKQSLLRPLATINQVNKCISILKSKPKIKRSMWSRRAQEYEQKITSGKIYDLAEVVRDLNKGDDIMVDQSYSERQLFEKAYERILSEFQIVLGLSMENTQKNFINLSLYKSQHQY